MAAFPPRLERENTLHYEGFIHYCEFGASRSLQKVCAKVGRTMRTVEKWSAEFRWVERARQYDEAITTELTQSLAADRVDAFKADLMAHRDASMKVGKKLLEVAEKMLEELPKRLGDEWKPTALGTIARTITMSLDVLAHGLGVDQLLPRLTGESDNEQPE